MKCGKCGIEFFEGRNCPNCGKLAIFVKDDEYEERKAEWEIENAPKEEENPKFKLKINIDPATVKKVLKIVAVVALAAMVIIWIMGKMIFVAGQAGIHFAYDNGTYISGDLRSYNVYSSESKCLSTDGFYVAQYNVDTSSFEGEVVATNCDKTGKIFATVTANSSADNDIYSLYLTKNGESILVAQGSNYYRPVEINENELYYEVVERGTFDVVASSNIYRYCDNASYLVCDKVADFTKCDTEDTFIVYTTDDEILLFGKNSGGKLETIAEYSQSDAKQLAYTCEKSLYYVNSSRELVLAGNDDKVVDSGVLEGTLKSVSFVDTVVYMKENGLYAVGGAYKKPTMIFEGYSNTRGKGQVLGKYGSLYFVYDNELYRAKPNGKNKMIKTEVEAVYVR